MEIKKKVFIQGIVGLLSIFGVTYGRIDTVPDNVRRIYGLPLAWGVNQLVTIVGPVDSWNITLLYLVFDLVFWIALIIVAPILLEEFTIVSCDRCERRRMRAQTAEYSNYISPLFFESVKR